MRTSIAALVPSSWFLNGSHGLLQRHGFLSFLPQRKNRSLLELREIHGKFVLLKSGMRNSLLAATALAGLSGALGFSAPAVRVGRFARRRVCACRDGLRWGREPAWQ